jgi:exodeoxyribonuclease VII small subunit
LIFNQQSITITRKHPVRHPIKVDIKMSSIQTPQNFEEGMSELETLVKKLEEGRMPLEDAIQAFERGSYLRKFCEDKLLNAKLKVDQILVDTEGSIKVESFNTAQS